MKALVTERVGKGVAWMPFHFGGWFAGRDLRGNYPKGSDPIVLGESAYTITTYGYDPPPGMYEPKVTLCQIAAALGVTTMARMKVRCAADRCIECNACVTACKNEHEVPWG